MTVSHPPGGRLPLLSARPAVTSPTAEHHRPLAGNKLYCLMTAAHRCKQLALGCYAALPRAGFEPATDWSQAQMPYLLRHPPCVVSTTLMAQGGQWQKWVPYMGTVAVAGCSWSSRGDTLRWEVDMAGWARTLHGIFRRRHWRAVVVAWQAAGCSGWCTWTGGFLVETVCVRRFIQMF